MMNVDYICDTPECIYWSEEGGCTMKTAITIQEHRCLDYETKLPEYIYMPISGIPPLQSSVYVSVSGKFFHKARFLGYGVYGNDPTVKTYCVEVLKDSGHRFVDFFREIYSRKLEGD